MTIFLFIILQLLEIDYVTLNVYQRQKKRDAIITIFTKCDNKA